MANGELLIRQGVVGRSRAETQPRTASAIVYLPTSNNGQLQLVLHVANFDWVVGGIGNAISIGTVAQVHGERDKHLAFVFCLLGICLMMGLYHLGLYALRREQSYSLFYGIATLLAGLRVLFDGVNYITELLPLLPWEVQMQAAFLIGFLPAPFLGVIRTPTIAPFNRR